jgi:dihydrolipoamide dehydrogenase
VECRAEADGLFVRFEGREPGEGRFDRVLVAVGRRPVTQGFGLETTRVSVDAKGFIEVGEDRRTAEPHIFAIGDVAGQPMLAHKASAEGRVAAEAIAGQKAVFEPMAIPAVVFTDPEIAYCGLLEDEAKAKGLAVKVARFPWAASGRAATLGRSDGLTKIVVDAKTEQVLGYGIAGPGAGELIAEAVLAIEMGAVAEDVARTIHPHPTLSETVMEAAEGIYGPSTHYYGRG